MIRPGPFTASRQGQALGMDDALRERDIPCASGMDRGDKIGHGFLGEIWVKIITENFDFLAFRDCKVCGRL
jgi:hypothetical protein